MVLQRKEKIKDRVIFRNTRTFNVLVKNDFFKLIGRKRKEEKQFFPLVATIASKKKIKKAVQRNRAKRRLEEAYRLLKSELESEFKKFDYLIFFLEEKSIGAQFEILIQEIKRIKVNLK
ncbi:MAG: ribonuclease P protein component [Candidatus Caenarcaniphilales bacterium]|nr:ribonuclease P protein component [Candidatus Caenarcaniphilales bacterium]